MKHAFRTLLALLAIAPAALRADEPAAQPAEPAQPAPAEAAAPAPAAEAAAPAEPAAPAEAAPAPVQDMQPVIKEFRQLQFEIFQARKALRDHERIAALRKLQDEAKEAKDMAAFREYGIQIRAATEELLAHQPGMPEKLARLKELGESLRRDLPAEQRRKGKRLPRAEVEAADAKAAAEEAAEAATR